MTIFLGSITRLLHVLSSCLLYRIMVIQSYKIIGLIEKIHKKFELHFESKCEHDKTEQDPQHSL